MSCVNFVRIYISQSTGDPWFRVHNFIAIPIIAVVILIRLDTTEIKVALVQYLIFTKAASYILTSFCIYTKCVYIAAGTCSGYIALGSYIVSQLRARFSLHGRERV